MKSKYILLGICAAVLGMVAYDVYAANGGDCKVDWSDTFGYMCNQQDNPCTATITVPDPKWYYVWQYGTTTSTAAAKCATHTYGGDAETTPPLTITYTTNGVPSTTTVEVIPGQDYCQCGAY